MLKIKTLLIPVALTLFALLSACSQDNAPPPQASSTDMTSEMQRLQARAERVEIIRDDFGVAHIYGETDADVVFGFLYAQAEDDFPRIERNYTWAIGRLAEGEGESAL